MRVLDERDLAFFQNNGYVVVRNAVPAGLCRAAAAALWAFLEMNPDDPDDWYRAPARPGVTTAEMYHHQTFWDVRQHPRVYGAFADVLGEERLWVSIDRAGFKPPRHRRHSDWDFKGFIHWDGDPAELHVRRKLSVQGVLCLTATTRRMGGFQCIPGHHRRLADWLARPRTGRRPPLVRRIPQRWLGRTEPPPNDNPLSPESLLRAAELSGYAPRAVKRLSNAAGDLIIWDQRLPHGNGRNVSRRPRLALYVSMFPAEEDDESFRQTRLRLWREREAPPGAGDPRAWERRHCDPAILTDLGRRLLGLDAWPPAPADTEAPSRGTAAATRARRAR